MSLIIPKSYWAVPPMTIAIMRFVVATVLIALPIWSAPSEIVLTVSSFSNRGGINLHKLAM